MSVFDTVMQGAQPQYAGQQQQSPYSNLEQMANDLRSNSNQLGQRHEQQMASYTAANNQYMELLKKLLNKKDESTTGNPFTDMLNGYIRMKQSANPNYQWQGALPMAAKGIGYLGKQIGAGASGLFGLLSGGNQVPIQQAPLQRAIPPEGGSLNFLRKGGV